MQGLSYAFESPSHLQHTCCFASEFYQLQANLPQASRTYQEHQTYSAKPGVMCYCVVPEYIYTSTMEVIFFKTPEPSGNSASDIT